MRHGPSALAWWAVSDGVSPLFVLYLGGYLGLTLLVVAVLGVLVDRTGGVMTWRSLAVVSAQLRVRWVLVCVMLSLAGLPPFGFFVCKLGLLACLFQQGGWAVSLGCLCGVFVSWGLYYAAVRLLLVSAAAGQVAVGRRSRLTGPEACLVVTLVGLVGLGGLFAGDLWLVCTWVLA